MGEFTDEMNDTTSHTRIVAHGQRVFLSCWNKEGYLTSLRPLNIGVYIMDFVLVRRAVVAVGRDTASGRVLLCHYENAAGRGGCIWNMTFPFEPWIRAPFRMHISRSNPNEILLIGTFLGRLGEVSSNGADFFVTRIALP
jgi:hypothetical protein